MKGKTPWLILSSLLILIALLIWVLWESASTQDGLHREVVKFLMQLGLIVLVGGTVAAWCKYYWEEETRERERFRQAAIERGTIYRGYMARVGSAYREAKATRRILRASGLSQKRSPSKVIVAGLLLESYKGQMLLLNQAQLQLEGLKIEAKHHPELREKTELFDHLEDMEKYLGAIIGEYEAVGQEASLSELVHLDEFTDSSDAEGKKTKRRFDQHFATAYEEVVKLLGNLLERVDESRVIQGP